jgi:hypothetical protein
LHSTSTVTVQRCFYNCILESANLRF